MNPAQLPDHISYSQLSTYLQCPLKYRFHYIDRLEPEFTSGKSRFWPRCPSSGCEFLSKCFGRGTPYCRQHGRCLQASLERVRWATYSIRQREHRGQTAEEGHRHPYPVAQQARPVYRSVRCGRTIHRGHQWKRRLSRQWTSSTCRLCRPYFEDAGRQNHSHRPEDGGKEAKPASSGSEPSAHSIQPGRQNFGVRA